MNKTGIEYLNYTWNPIAMRCSPISKGCENCWHLKSANRLSKNPKISKFAQEAYAGRSWPQLIQSRLDGPLKVKKPSMIGVQFMGDLFHDDIQDHKINSVFLRMVNTDRHKYLILTKRPKRMADFISIGTGWRGRMPNVWLGVTVEHPDYLWRIDELLKIPAAVRFVSLEPMLSRVKLDLFRCTHSQIFHKKPTQNTCWCYDQGEYLTRWDCKIEGIKWVICGAETGPGARPLKLEWARDLRDQCKVAGVPFFFKSAGRQETPDDLMVREFPICTNKSKQM